MSKGRLEAFSDGVIAILITILVLGLVPPRGSDLAALAELLPHFLAYVLSFVFIAIYWNNHHHLLQAAAGVDGRVLWANMHLLFWMSLLPFVTGWMGATGFPSVPVAAYGAVCLLAAIAYYLLELALLRLEPAGSGRLRAALGGDAKGRLSPVAYAIAIAAAFALPWVSLAVYAGVAMAWLVPDRRIERSLRG